MLKITPEMSPQRITRLQSMCLPISEVRPFDLFAGADRDRGHDSQLFGREVLSTHREPSDRVTLRLSGSAGYTVTAPDFKVWVLRPTFEETES